MDYTIVPGRNIEGVYTWRFESLNEARLAAHQLAVKEGIKVEVFKLVGTQIPRTDWVANPPDETERTP